MLPGARNKLVPPYFSVTYLCQKVDPLKSRLAKIDKQKTKQNKKHIMINVQCTCNQAYAYKVIKKMVYQMVDPIFFTHFAPPGSGAWGKCPPLPPSPKYATVILSIFWTLFKSIASQREQFICCMSGIDGWVGQARQIYF